MTTHPKPNTGLHTHVLGWVMRHEGQTFTTGQIVHDLKADGIEVTPTSRSTPESTVNTILHKTVKEGVIEGLIKLRVHTYRYDPGKSTFEPSDMRHIGADIDGNPLYLAGNGRVYRVLYEEVK